jgi:hypothetical protein
LIDQQIGKGFRDAAGYPTRLEGNIMKKFLIGFVLLAVLLPAATAFGYLSDPAVVTWADNFDGQILGTAPNNMTGWTGYTGNYPANWSVVDDGGNQVVATTNSTSTVYQYAWTAGDLGLAGATEQILHFSSKLFSAGPPPGSGQVKTAFHLVNNSGVPIGGWRLTGTGIIPLVWNSAHSSNGSGLVPHLGAEIAWGGNAYRDFDRHWFPATGLLDWYLDGNLVDSWVNADMIGVDATILQWDDGSAHANVVYYDDVKVGIVPEPATLALLVLGALPMLRRRVR